MYFMKYIIITALYFIAGAMIIAGLLLYVAPIFIGHRNAVFNDNASSLTASMTSEMPRREVPITQQSSSSVGTTFEDSFDATYVVREMGSMNISNNRNWWVSSGGYFYSENGVGRTSMGALFPMDPWRVAYALANPVDTDGGYYPQNIFRLVSRQVWNNFTQEAYVRIARINMSASPNRNASNGILFFNRYQDAYNLYYAGIRVDGAAVIKKKLHGTYYTLAYKPLYQTDTAYDRDANPNVLPLHRWIGLRSEVRTDPETQAVTIKLFVDMRGIGDWVLAAEAIDDGRMYGGETIAQPGYAGMRTDFMDAEFSRYSIVEE